MLWEFHRLPGRLKDIKKNVAPALKSCLNVRNYVAARELLERVLQDQSKSAYPETGGLDEHAVENFSDEPMSAADLNLLLHNIQGQSFSPHLSVSPMKALLDLITSHLINFPNAYQCDHDTIRLLTARPQFLTLRAVYSVITFLRKLPPPPESPPETTPTTPTPPQSDQNGTGQAPFGKTAQGTSMHEPLMPSSLRGSHSSLYGPSQRPANTAAESLSPTLSAGSGGDASPSSSTFSPSTDPSSGALATPSTPDAAPPPLDAETSDSPRLPPATDTADHTDPSVRMPSSFLPHLPDVRVLHNIMQVYALHGRPNAVKKWMNLIIAAEESKALSQSRRIPALRSGDGGGLATSVRSPTSNLKPPWYGDREKPGVNRTALLLGTSYMSSLLRRPRGDGTTPYYPKSSWQDGHDEYAEGEKSQDGVVVSSIDKQHDPIDVEETATSEEDIYTDRSSKALSFFHELRALNTGASEGEEFLPEHLNALDTPAWTAAIYAAASSPGRVSSEALLDALSNLGNSSE